MPHGINPLAFAFGHQWADVNPQHAHIGEHLNMRTNIAKLIGYIPVLSVLIGVFRIIGIFEKETFKEVYPSLALHTKQDEDSVTLRTAVRAIIEILSISLILVLFDVIADVVRLNRYES